MRLENLQALVQPVVESEGLELVLVEARGEAHGRVLRVYMDKPGGITHADCERVSRRLSEVLDADEEATGGGAFTLEVSSPGMDRPLVKPADYERFHGKRVHLETRQPLAGRRRFTGVLSGFADGRVKLDLEAGAVAEIEWENIEKAHLAPLWPQPAVPGPGGRRKR